MIETLEIYKDNLWHELDLLKPSGITIKFESPILKGFDTLTSDKSYSFTLPLTSKNALALGLSSDIRVEDNFSERYECRYSFNGYSPKGKAYLYLSGVDGSLQANITFNILNELVSMKEDGKLLNEIKVKEEEDLEYSIDEYSTIPRLLGQVVGQMAFEQTDSQQQDGYYSDYETEFNENYNNGYEEIDGDVPEYEGPEYDAPDYDEPEY